MMIKIRMKILLLDQVGILWFDTNENLNSLDIRSLDAV